MLADKFDLLSTLWKKDFKDVPWMAQSIDVLECNQAGRYQLIVEGGSESLSITPFIKSPVNGAALPLSEKQYDLALAPNGKSISLEIRSTSQIEFLRVGQVGESATLARIVCLKQDDAGWVVVYNSLDRERLLIQSMKNLINTDNKNEQELFLFLGFLIERDFKKALAIFENSDGIKLFRSQAEEMTAKFNLQINAHGIKKTFKYWTNSEKHDYLKATVAVMQALKDITPYVSLGFGAVLGYVRENDLIGHDDDLDIIVALEHSQVKDLGAALLGVANCLSNHGFKVEGEFFSHVWVGVGGGSRLDVFVGLIEHDESVSFYPSARNSLKFQNIFPTKPVEIYGVEIPMPADCPVYLEKTYGSGWSKPDIKFNHPWSRDDYADIAGVRNRPVMWTRGELQAKRMQLKK